jgi:hypothetical protein
MLRAARHKVPSCRPVALAKSLTREIERGIAALTAYMGDGAGLLKQVAPRREELASFEFPLPPDFLGQERTLELGFPSSFPRALMQVRVTPNAWLVWPHIMQADSACLFEDGRPFNASPEDAVQRVMARVRELVQFASPATSDADRKAEFDREIATYWAQQLGFGPTQLLLLDTPSTECVLFVLSDARQRPKGAPPSLWMSTDKSALSQLADRVGMLPGKFRQLAKGAYFQRLDSSPDLRVPTASGLVDWLAPCCSDHAAGIKAWLETSRGLPERHVVLALPERDGTRNHMALTLRAGGLKKRASPIYGKRAARRVHHHSPLNKLNLMRSLLQVMSRDAVHSRDAASAASLADKHVVLVGVGSLGSQVATQLARAGVGHLTLIDPDILNAENLGRHVLGIDDLGRYKVDAMRDRLMRDVPTVAVAAVPSWVELSTSDKALQTADLVVVTTADWHSELWLWRRKLEGASWPLMQGWSEPHGVAGHVLVAPAESTDDGTQLFDASGVFRHPSTNGWQNDGFVDRPQCGGRFIPGGPIGLAAISTLASRVAVESLQGRILAPQWHRYTANEDSVRRAGGTLLRSEDVAAADAVFDERPWPDVSAEATSA